MKRTLCVALAALIILPAVTAGADLPSRGTIGLYLATGENDLSRAGTIKVGEPFEIVVRTDAVIGTGAAVFAITELNLEYPGIFKVSTSRINDSTLDMGDNDLGEYVIAYQTCVAAGEQEVVRVGYADTNGDLPEDVLLYVGGVADTEPHSRDLDGAPGIVGCDPESGGMTEVYSLVPEPWDAASEIDPMTIEGVTVTDGLLVLNPSQLVPNAMASVGTLKSRF